MRTITKLGAALVLGFTALATGITVFSSSYRQELSAAACNHTGNHYSLVEPTASESGSKEYWVCCKCHEHFFTKPSGTWSDAGQSNIQDKNDDRYLAPGHLSSGIVLSGDGKTISSYTPVPGVTDIVIPEGVETIGDGVFEGSDITSVTLPSTLKEIGDDAFAETDNLTSIVIPGSVEEIAANAFLDNPNGLGYLFGSGRDITIYLEITKAEADAQFEKGWDNASTSYFLFGKASTNKATVYYKGQWHYDDSGNPTPNKK